MKTALTIEQSADLILLGVDAKYASGSVATNIYEQEYSDPRHPIFTLNDLLGLLPKWIKYYNEILWLNIYVSYFSEKWCAAYRSQSDIDEADTFLSANELVDCLYLLLKHLLTEKTCGDMKIYIVTSGTYSDYGIEAVFTTEENAKAYIDKHGDYDNRRIEEYDADSEDIERKNTIYTVYIAENGGQTACPTPCDEPDTIHVYERISYPKSMGYIITVETDGAERAKKIASERLMQVKAMPYLFPRLYEKCVKRIVFGYPELDYPTYNFHTKEIILGEDEILK